MNSVHEGATSIEEAIESLSRVPVQDMGFARLDTHRQLRLGMPEAIYAEGKTAEETVAITARLLEATTGPVLATRVPQATATALLEAFPTANHHKVARLTVLRSAPAASLTGGLLVATGGTSDLPVAEEAALVAEAVGASVTRITDIGVAGVHRALAAEGDLRAADVVIVVAGMEGALASLIGGITPAPVIAVPTSVGYGASFEGLAALLGMLTSCAAGITVTNIDNGFGAAMAAVRILQRGNR